MRTLPASYLFLALPLLWQGVAYGQEEPAYTDTLDWRRFLPLEVGNEWQQVHYHVPHYYEPDCCDPQLGGMFRETIIGDSLSVEGGTVPTGFMRCFVRTILTIGRQEKVVDTIDTIRPIQP